MIVLRIRDGSEKTLHAMGVIVTVRRIQENEVELGFRYAPGTKAAIPERIVDKPRSTPQNTG